MATAAASRTMICNLANDWHYGESAMGRPGSAARIRELRAFVNSAFRVIFPYEFMVPRPVS